MLLCVVPLLRLHGIFLRLLLALLLGHLAVHGGAHLRRVLRELFLRQLPQLIHVLGLLGRLFSAHRVGQAFQLLLKLRQLLQRLDPLRARDIRAVEALQLRQLGDAIGAEALVLVLPLALARVAHEVQVLQVAERPQVLQAGAQFIQVDEVHREIQLS
eukprot:scaffold1340_cov253-Pinguiococcus_pyrenoidosus.AAC.38